MIDDQLAITGHQLKCSTPKIQIIYTHCQWKISKYGTLYRYLPKSNIRCLFILY